MALDSWNAIDEYALNAEEHYCAFLDILGYKNKSDEFFDGKFNLQGRFERAIEHVLEQIQFIHNVGFVDTSLLSVRFFSDSVVINHPCLKNNKDSLFNIFIFSRMLATHLSFEGLFVRGAIAKGKHIDTKNETYEFLSSKALEKAYLLESTQAIYPRILIDESLISDLTGHVKTLVVRESDKYILHFAPQLINEQGDNESVVLKEMEDIYQLYTSLDSQHVKDKYRWVLDYYYWTLTQTPNIDISLFQRFKTENINRFSVL